jgi:predicted transcriptional regulator
MNKVLKFGIAPVPVQRARTLAIAAGTRQRGKDEPNVWFPTVTAMARVLSDENMALLKVIRESHPDSMDALAKAVGKTCSQRIAVAAHHGPIWFGQAHQAWPNGHAAGYIREGYC